MVKLVLTKLGLKRLEPYDGKLSSTVLRGRRSWQLLLCYPTSQRHKKILKDANLIIKKIEGKNERIFFLVMAGSYPSLTHAKLLCKQLSKRRQNCIVTK